MTQKIKLKKGDHIYCEKGCKVAEATADVRPGLDYKYKFDFKFETEKPKLKSLVGYTRNKCGNCGAPWVTVSRFGGFLFFNKQGVVF